MLEINNFRNVNQAGQPVKHGLYDPKYEHDACGVGFVANIDGNDMVAFMEESYPKVRCVLTSNDDSLLWASDLVHDQAVLLDGLDYIRFFSGSVYWNR